MGNSVWNVHAEWILNYNKKIIKKVFKNLYIRLIKKKVI